MEKLDRVKKVVKWLLLTDYAVSESDLAEKLGYKKSSLSQILNKKVPLSDKFVQVLCDADKNINKVWIEEGEGSMIVMRDEYNISYMEKAEWYALKNAKKSTEIDTLEETNKAQAIAIRVLTEKIDQLETDLKTCREGQ